jgi:hypothetical protein
MRQVFQLHSLLLLEEAPLELHLLWRQLLALSSRHRLG